MMNKEPICPLKGQEREEKEYKKEYKEECIFTTIDMFSGVYEYLSMYYISEVCFKDLWFTSPYHCYFFLRAQFEKDRLLKESSTLLEDSKKTEEGNASKEVLKMFQTEEIKNYLEKVENIHYEEETKSNEKKKLYEVLIEIINKLTVSELIDNGNYFSENPEWKKNRLDWIDAVLRDKFRRSEVMRQRLLETGKREIVYKVKNEEVEKIQNSHMIKDLYFFGVFENKGQNNLGRIYMNIRNDITNNNEIYTWLLTNHNMQTDKNLVPDIFVEEQYVEKIVEEDTDSLKKTKRELKEDEYVEDSYKTETKVKKHTFEKKEYISFGKNEKNDIICLNPSISRFHCVLYFNKDYHLYLLDVGSKARTKLNDTVCEILKKYKIENDDIIQLGVSKRKYRVNINVDKVMAYLDEKQEQINEKMKLMTEELDESSFDKKMLKILNLYYKINQNDLLDFFRDCGPIKQVKIFDSAKKKDPKEKNSSGGTNEEEEQEQEQEKQRKKKEKRTKVALVEVYDIETANNIIQKNDCYLYGNKISIHYLPIHSNDSKEEKGNTKGKNFDYISRKKEQNYREHDSKRYKNEHKMSPDIGRSHRRSKYNGMRTYSPRYKHDYAHKKDRRERDRRFIDRKIRKRSERRRNHRSRSMVRRRNHEYDRKKKNRRKMRRKSYDSSYSSSSKHSYSSDEKYTKKSKRYSSSRSYSNSYTSSEQSSNSSSSYSEQSYESDKKRRKRHKKKKIK